MGIPKEAYPYFDHDVEFDTRQASTALAEAGVGHCPRLESYLDVLVRWARENPRIFGWSGHGLH